MEESTKGSPSCQHVSMANNTDPSTWSPILEAVWSSENQPAPATPVGHMNFPETVCNLDSPPESDLEPKHRHLKSSEQPAPMAPSFSRTYTRRRRKLQIVVPNQGTPTAGSSPGRTSTPPSRPRTCFLTKLTKKTSRILPTPRASRLRSHARTPAAPPRRSRRIAGAAPEIADGGAPSRLKKKVMRALGIIGETEGISHESLEEYSRLFSQSSSLITIHVKAMMVLFG
jgi:hypothetical protein